MIFEGFFIDKLFVFAQLAPNQFLFGLEHVKFLDLFFDFIVWLLMIFDLKNNDGVMKISLIYFMNPDNAFQNDL